MRKDENRFARALAAVDWAKRERATGFVVKQLSIGEFYENTQLAITRQRKNTSCVAGLQRRCGVLGWIKAVAS